MNKKTNTFLFILGATLFNVIITIVSFLITLVIYTKFLYSRLPENSIAWVLPIIFLFSIIISFIVYRRIIKLLMKKFDIEKYFAPIFGSRKPLE